MSMLRPIFMRLYGDNEAVYEIDTLRVYAGGLPRGAHNMVLEWADGHRRELMDCWNASREGRAPDQIEPLR